MERVFLQYFKGNKTKCICLVLCTLVILVYFELMKFVTHKYNVPRINISLTAPTRRITLKYCDSNPNAGRS